MFNADDIQTRVQEQPFMPFRLTTSSGQNFDIFHPELIMVGRRALILGTASTENPKQFDVVTRVSILHVTALQDISPAVKNAGNGEA